MSAVPKPTVVQRVLALVRSVDSPSVPITMPSIISHNLDSRAAKLGPANSCQTFVARDGIISTEAAVTGGMNAPSAPIATVGSPIPVTPLTTPARMKTAAIISGWEGRARAWFGSSVCVAELIIAQMIGECFGGNRSVSVVRRARPHIHSAATALASGFRNSCHRAATVFKNFAIEGH